MNHARGIWHCSICAMERQRVVFVRWDLVSKLAVRYKWMFSCRLLRSSPIRAGSVILRQQPNKQIYKQIKHINDMQKGNPHHRCTAPLAVKPPHSLQPLATFSPSPSFLRCVGISWCAPPTLAKCLANCWASRDNCGSSFKGGALWIARYLLCAARASRLK